MLGLGAVWAVVWAPIGAGIVTIQFVARGMGLPPLELLGPILLSGAKNGFLAGFVFAGGLGMAYRSRTFADLRPATIGTIGAAAGMLLPAGTILAAGTAGLFAPPGPLIAVMLVFAGVLGAVTAIGSLKVAQAAPPAVESGEASGVLKS